jgi:hypothetical protein
VSRKQHQELTKVALEIARVIIDAEIPRRRAENLKRAEMLATGLVVDLVAAQQPDVEDDAA